MQVADTGTGLGHRLPSSSRISRSTPWVDGVLWSHVDHDPLLDTFVAADLIPVATADGEDLALGRVVRTRLPAVSDDVFTHLYSRRVSEVAPSHPCTPRGCHRAGSPALWMPHPVVGHLDPGQPRVTVEDDPEEVEASPARASCCRGRCPRSTARADRCQGTWSPQTAGGCGSWTTSGSGRATASGVPGPVHAIGAQTHLEAQRG